MPGEAIEYQAESEIDVIRDQFAAAALAGVCSNPALAGKDINHLAQTSYDIADEMLKVRTRYASRP